MLARRCARLSAAARQERPLDDTPTLDPRHDRKLEVCFQDEVKGFGDAAARAEAHVDSFRHTYSGRLSVKIGGAPCS